MSSLASLTSGAPIPTQTACFPNIAPTLEDVNGLSGRVCQINLAPDIVDIQSCCNSGAEVRIQDNCTQYCEADDRDFSDCVTDKLETTPVTFPGVLCEVFGGNASTSTSASASSTTERPTATESGGAVEETDTPGAAPGNLGRYSLAVAAISVTLTLGLFHLF